MKTEERTYTTTHKKFVYITDDGKEFEQFTAARRHEIEINYDGELKGIETYLPTVDTTCFLYDIKNLEDFKYLFYYICNQDGRAEDYYKGADWYVDEVYDGGDHQDRHYVSQLSVHIAELEEEISKLKDLTSK